MLARLIRADRPFALPRPFGRLRLAIAHASEADARHRHSGIAKLGVLHVFSPPRRRRFSGRCKSDRELFERSAEPKADTRSNSRYCGCLSTVTLPRELF